MGAWVFQCPPCMPYCASDYHNPMPSQAQDILDHCSHSTTLLVSRPGLRPAIQGLMAGRGARVLPRWLGLEAIDEGFLHRARAVDDVPRSRRQRVAELAALLEHRQLDASAPPMSPAAAQQLAAEWVRLFECWDFLEVAQAAGLLAVPWAPPETTLPILAPIYRAAHDPNDLAFWLQRHPPESAESAVLVSVGPASPLAQAVAAVGWGGRVEPLELAWLPESLERSAAAFPEVLSGAGTSAGAVPTQPAHTVAQRRQVLAPWGLRLRAFEASTLEQAAGWALERGLQASAEGRRLALVAADRLLLRRLQALAREAGLPLHDPSGYSLITSVSSTAVLGLLEVALDASAHQALAAWLSHPWVQSLPGLPDDWPSDGLARWHADRARRPLNPGIPSLPPGLLRAIRPWPFSEGPALAWHMELEQRITELGLMSCIQSDEGGVAIWSALQAAAASSGDVAITGPRYLALVRRSLQEANLTLRSPQALVRVVGIEEAAQMVDADVLLLGGSADQFPPQPPARLAESETEAMLLGELAPGQEHRLVLGAILRILERGARLDLLGIRVAPEQALAWSRPLERLLWLCGVQALPARPTTGALPQGSPHRPHAAAGLQAVPQLPAELSVSAMVDFALCPQRFSWRVLQGGRNAPSLAPSPGASDAGVVLHRFMQWLAAATLPEAEVEAPVEVEAVVEAFAQQTGLPRVPALLERAPAAVAWIRAQQALGVVHEASELQLRVPLAVLGTTLVGQFDRLDRPHPQSWRLLDFKSTGASSLRRTLKDGIAHGDQPFAGAGALQLQVYAEMLAISPPADRPAWPVTQLGLVSMQREGFDLLEATPEPGVLARLESALVRALESNAFPAWARASTGGKACQHCPAAGVCRG